jgi:hypothetical protein
VSILAADDVCNLSLIGADETGTLAALRALLKYLVEPALKRHYGCKITAADGPDAKRATIHALDNRGIRDG